MYCLQCAREGIICDAPCIRPWHSELDVCLTTALKVALTRGKEEEKHSDINDTDYEDMEQWYD